MSISQPDPHEIVPAGEQEEEMTVQQLKANGLELELDEKEPQALRAEDHPTPDHPTGRITP